MIVTWKKIGFIVGSLAAFLVAGDLAGVAVCFFGDIVFDMRWSIAAVYALWLVLGIFAGLFHYQVAGKFCSPGTGRDWSMAPDSEATGTRIIAVSATVLLALSGLFYRVWWRQGIESDDGYVPDCMGTTLTFFGAIMAAVWLMRSVDRKDGTKKG